MSAQASVPPAGQVVIPEHHGKRSTTALGRLVVADALAALDAESADRATDESDWRKSYVRHFASLVQSAATSSDSSLASARAGLSSLQQRMKIHTPGGECPLAEGLPAELTAARSGHTQTHSIQPTTRPNRCVEVPYRGALLSGQALVAQLDRWADSGVVEPAFSRAVAAVVAQPEALDFGKRPVILMGAGAALGPLDSLLSWGVPVIAVDVPNGAVQRHIIEKASRGASHVRLPQSSWRGTPGLSLNSETAALSVWLDGALDADDAPVLAASFYADGGTHVELTAAHIAIADRLRTERPETSLAYLATPTDAFLVPEDAVAHAAARWDDAAWNGARHAATRLASGRRLFRPAYPTTRTDDHGTAWGFTNTLVEIQGPNYALAKRAQRWHAVTSAHEGTTVSANVAPSSWTASVTKNRALASVFRAAHRFGVEIFDADTASALMAVKMAADIAGLTPAPPPHPEALFSHDAAHGGLWRQPFEPSSALPVAGLLGLATRYPHKES